MGATGVSILLWFAALGCGLMGGLYFAFSAFIMRALGSLGHPAGAAAMNAINADILRSPFMPLFLATTLASVVAAALGLVDPGARAALPMLVGGLVYFVGMFVITMVCNVPLNNALAAGSTGADEIWALYLQRWTLWNHVRTLASIAACALFILALSRT